MLSVVVFVVLAAQRPVQKVGGKKFLDQFFTRISFSHALIDLPLDLPGVE